MPKLIDYPRTDYTGAWELAEVTDDTGGKCTIENAAKKLDRKVSGSFKAIIGSSVKFGLITSKRELLTTTTLFKRIKHAYDKQEELTFHREAFLTPPLFTQICRKFRCRELPVQMLDLMLIREFGVEEINAQGVAKAFVNGCKMMGLLDEHNVIADIDAFSRTQGPRQQLSSPTPIVNTFRPENILPTIAELPEQNEVSGDTGNVAKSIITLHKTDELPEYGINHREVATAKTNDRNTDAIANLFGFTNDSESTLNLPEDRSQQKTTEKNNAITQVSNYQSPEHNVTTITTTKLNPLVTTSKMTYQVQINGPGISTELTITDEEDIVLAIALLEKIRRQLKS